ncbi:MULTISPECIES: PepSY domain-containing protein [unclassified Janthinobacterium]|uniref:PepSY-associated TM helix domain-containing protein n=1 Tax=unclassified Janthinobacterium TaxID=2610881 RepID=UPI001609257C|nr:MULTISPECIES: PepSY-associated TM helix domain-containing protein [unclassified Janthinobacterium]MBB5606130.1 putative iron-regulated membrane protein [Janthinobacterium sp. S3T4]MBB5611997.1 putative iron-regulated membrane protein [Janthinobacterium sp. S3M3]
MRPALAALHRYAGLLMAGFLIVAGLTGSALAWKDELEGALLPGVFRVTPPAPGAVPLDALLLRERVAAHFPQAQISFAPLSAPAGHSMQFYLPHRDDAPLASDEVFVDPYTGAMLGQRRWGEISQGLINLLPFIERLHYALALGDTGLLMFGLIAILWTIDCFIGAALTFPARLKNCSPGAKPWLQRWRPSWLLRRHGGSYKLVFDLHRAGGLWLWAMLLVFAWSGVAFNLYDVYAAVMKPIFPHQPTEEVLATHTPTRAPQLNWQEARAQGRVLMAGLADQQHFSIIEENALSYESRLGLYSYKVRSSRDVREQKGLTTVIFDAASGKLVTTWLPTGTASGDTFRSWISALHMASMWGWPFKLFICAMGVAVTGLSLTGVLVWRRKRQGQAKADKALIR